MKHDLATVRQAVKRKTDLLKPPGPAAEHHVQEKSDLSAVRRIVQRKGGLGKQPKQMVKPALNPRPTDDGQTTQPEILPVERPKTMVKPVVRENDGQKDRQARQYVEESSIIDMLKSAVDRISIITEDTKKQ